AAGGRVLPPRRDPAVRAAPAARPVGAARSSHLRAVATGHVRTGRGGGHTARTAGLSPAAGRAAAVDDGLDALVLEAVALGRALERGRVELGVEILDRATRRADEVV